MKKLLLMAAFGLLASPALAQNNTGSITQTGDDSEAYIDQLGGSNTATITQVNPDGEDVNAWTTQRGVGSTASQSQTVYSSASSAAVNATVNQMGGGNDADQTQSFDGFLSSTAMDATVQQNGSGNVRASQTQSFSGTLTNSDIEARITQETGNTQLALNGSSFRLDIEASAASFGGGSASGTAPSFVPRRSATSLQTPLASPTSCHPARSRCGEVHTVAQVPRTR